MPKVKKTAKATLRAEKYQVLKTGLRQVKAEVNQLLAEVKRFDEKEAEPVPVASNDTELSPEALQLVQLCLDNDLHERLGSLIMSWDKSKLAALVQSWSSTTFAVVCRPWPAQFTASLLEGRSARWITSVCESMNVDEIAQLLPLLEKKAKLVMGKLYFASDDRFLSPDECKEIMSSLTEQQRNSVIRKYGSAAAQIMESDDSMGDDESEDNSDPNTDEDDEYDGSFIDDDDDVEVEVDGNDDDSDEDYVAE